MTVMSIYDIIGIDDKVGANNMSKSRVMVTVWGIVSASSIAKVNSTSANSSIAGVSDTDNASCY